MNLNYSVATDCLINATVLNAELRVLSHVNRVIQRNNEKVGLLDMAAVDQLINQIDALGEFCRSKSIDVTSSPFYQCLDDVFKSRFEKKWEFRRLVLMQRGSSIDEFYEHIVKHHKIKCVLGLGKYYLLSPSDNVVDVPDDSGLPVYSRVWHIFRAGHQKYSLRINSRVLVDLFQLIFDEDLSEDDQAYYRKKFSTHLNSEYEQY